jgi:hypothetical protein
MSRDNLHPVDGDPARGDALRVLAGQKGPGINPSDGGFSHSATVGSCSMLATSSTTGREETASEHEAVVCSSSSSDGSVIWEKLGDSVDRSFPRRYGYGVL